jgi:hypothetical protein
VKETFGPLITVDWPDEFATPLSQQKRDFGRLCHNFLSILVIEGELQQSCRLVLKIRRDIAEAV